MASARQQARDAAARQRGFASYYAERVAKAKQLGYENYSQRRKAKEGKAPLKPGDRRNQKQAPKQRINTGGMSVLTSRDWRYLRREFKSAGDTPVAVRATFSAVDRGEVIHRTYDISGWRQPDAGLFMLCVSELLQGVGWSQVSGKLQVFIGRGDIPASDWLDPVLSDDDFDLENDEEDSHIDALVKRRRS